MMKFLPESQKKVIMSAVLVMVSLGGTIYLNFFYGKPQSVTPPPNVVPADQLGDQVGTGQLNPPASGETPALPLSAAPSVVLPYGSVLDTTILDDERFRVLRSAPKVEIRPEELGKTNPFGG